MQQESFPEVFNSVAKKENLLTKNPLTKLNPIVHEGLIRVGGRIQHSLLSYDQKFPLILPKNHALTIKIIDHTHEKTLHRGIQLTLSTLRNNYWILKGRQVVKAQIHKCMKCLKYRASPAYQLMGNLPETRLIPSRPFEKSGVDGAGPDWIRRSPGRGAKCYKGYIILFICLSTKAIHLELVSDYTSESFLAAYRRMVSRRGHCTDIYSDQGTNFIGAAREIKSLFKESSQFIREVSDSLSKYSSCWHFNPSASPHYGGIWEAAVKSTKYHLKRVIGDAKLTFEEFTTLLCQVKACLNSRPLVPLSDDPCDVQSLTSAHFLIQSGSFLLPKPDLRDEKIVVSQRWKLLQQMLHHFWGRCSREYLQTLQRRNKWAQIGENLKVGE